jgi:hypothetical protein
VHWRVPISGGPTALSAVRAKKHTTNAENSQEKIKVKERRSESPHKTQIKAGSVRSPLLALFFFLGLAFLAAPT